MCCWRECGAHIAKINLINLFVKESYLINKKTVSNHLSIFFGIISYHQLIGAIVYKYKSINIALRRLAENKQHQNCLCVSAKSHRI